METKQNNFGRVRMLLTLLLIFTAMANAQIVTIPDANFKAALLNANPGNPIALMSIGGYVEVDTNHDGEIQESEAALINGLYIQNMNITNLTGIEAFVNLTTLNCSYNLLITLDTAMLPSTLTQLTCVACGLSALDPAPLVNLTSLNFNINGLTTFDISGLPALTSLNCQNNQLTSLNLSGSLPNFQALYCTTNHIASLNLSDLVNLKTLYCDNNLLTTLDLSPVVNLQEINCSRNLINLLDSSQLVQLYNLICYNNPLTTLLTPSSNSLTGLDYSYTQLSPPLDFLNLYNLTALFCEGNGIGSINLNLLPGLQILYCGHNPITSIDFAPSPNLYQLDITGSSVASIDFTQHPQITFFHCPDTPITTLDVRPLTDMVELICGGAALQSLYMKNGADDHLQLLSSPNLEFVCADEEEVAATQTIVANFGSASTVVSSYCSFVPGGNYNEVTGNIRLDLDNNGCDANDTIIPNNVRLNLTDGTIDSATFLNAQGQYSLYAAIGDYTLNSSLENPDYFNITPASATFNFPALNNAVATQDFCLTANGMHNDVEIVLVPETNARPGFDARYQLVYKNKGNQAISGSVNLIFDDARLDVVSAAPAADNVVLNGLTWNYSGLLPFETRTVELVLNVNTPLENPPVNSGSILNFTAAVNPIADDETPDDNIFNFNQTVVNSFDPNEKTCLEGETLSPEHIGKYLHYAINFENLGTAEAANVVVKDNIDATKFDISSLQVIAASNDVTTRIKGNVVEFIFRNINLAPLSGDPPVGGHGSILFKIKTLAALHENDEVSNEASIYFDYNMPITTNSARTHFVILDTPGFIKDESIVLYPNPAKDFIKIKADTPIKLMELFDIQGRILESVFENNKAVQLDISGKAKGIYFVRITTDKGKNTEKIIKE